MLLDHKVYHIIVEKNSKFKISNGKVKTKKLEKIYAQPSTKNFELEKPSSAEI